MKRLLLLGIGVVACTVASFAQSDYKNAIGGRFGTTYYDIFSASFKTFITKPGALEFNLGIGGRSYDHNPHYVDKTFAVSASAAYQHHFPIGNIEGFKWYVGGGLVIYNSRNDNDGNSDYDYDGFGFGLFPTGGVDYKVKSIPLNVSADFRPTLFVTAPGSYDSYRGNFGIAARYTF